MWTLLRPTGREVFEILLDPDFPDSRGGSPIIATVVGLVTLLGRLKSALASPGLDTLAKSIGWESLAPLYRPPLQKTVYRNLWPNLGSVGGRDGSHLHRG